MQKVDITFNLNIKTIKNILVEAYREGWEEGNDDNDITLHEDDAIRAVRSILSQLAHRQIQEEIPLKS